MVLMLSKVASLSTLIITSRLGSLSCPSLRWEPAPRRFCLPQAAIERETTALSIIKIGPAFPSVVCPAYSQKLQVRRLIQNTFTGASRHGSLRDDSLSRHDHSTSRLFQRSFAIRLDKVLDYRQLRRHFSVDQPDTFLSYRLLEETLS